MNATTSLSPFAYMSQLAQVQIANCQALLQDLLTRNITQTRRWPRGLLLFPGTTQSFPAQFYFPPFGSVSMLDLEPFSYDQGLLVSTINALMSTTLGVADIVNLVAQAKRGALFNVGGTPIARFDPYAPYDLNLVTILDPSAPAAPDPVVLPPGGGQYGQDTSCTDILIPGTLVSGVRLLAEACYRRLITTKGSLEYDPLYGYSLIDLLQRAMLPDEIASIPRNVRAELLKDDRLDDVTVDSAYDVGSASLTLTIAATASDGTSFALVMNASQVTAQIISITDTTELAA